MNRWQTSIFIKALEKILITTKMAIDIKTQFSTCSVSTIKTVLQPDITKYLLISRKHWDNWPCHGHWNISTNTPILCETPITYLDSLKNKTFPEDARQNTYQDSDQNQNTLRGISGIIWKKTSAIGEEVLQHLEDTRRKRWRGIIGGTGMKHNSK